MVVYSTGINPTGYIGFFGIIAIFLYILIKSFFFEEEEEKNGKSDTKTRD